MFINFVPVVIWINKQKNDEEDQRNILEIFKSFRLWFDEVLRFC